MADSITKIEKMIKDLESFEAMLSSIKREEHGNSMFRKNEEFKKGMYEVSKSIDHFKEFLYRAANHQDIESTIEKVVELL